MAWSRWCRAAAAMPMLLATVVAALGADVIQIKIKDLVFTPARVSARVGDTVEWVNGDFVDHTATARNGEWDVVIPAGATTRLVVKQAGTVDYYCRYHPGMTGQVQAAAK